MTGWGFVDQLRLLSAAAVLVAAQSEAQKGRGAAFPAGLRLNLSH